MRKLVLVAAAVATLSLGVQASAQREITREQARSLVQTTLRLRGDKISARQIQESTETTPGYYNFGAYEPQKNGLQNVAGWFAVNKRTGQVWDTTSCDLYQFPTLERQRRKLVRHSAKSTTKPPCAEGMRTHTIRKRQARRAPYLPEVAQ